MCVGGSVVGEVCGVAEDLLALLLQIALLSAGAVDVVCVSSAAAVCGLPTLLGACPEAKRPVVLAIGSEAEQAAAERGVRVDLLADDRGGPEAVVEVRVPLGRHGVCAMARTCLPPPATRRRCARQLLR
jgi:hypothetical protein